MGSVGSAQPNTRQGSMGLKLAAWLCVLKLAGAHASCLLHRGASCTLLLPWRRAVLSTRGLTMAMHPTPTNMVQTTTTDAVGGVGDGRWHRQVTRFRTNHRSNRRCSNPTRQSRGARRVRLRHSEWASHIRGCHLCDLGRARWKVLLCSDTSATAPHASPSDALAP